MVKRLPCADQFGKRGHVEPLAKRCSAVVCGRYLWLLDRNVIQPFQRCNISSKEKKGRGKNYHEGNRWDGPGCGNGRDEAGGAARAAGSDKRRRRSGSCVRI